MKTLPTTSTYEAAKAERSAFLVDYIEEYVMTAPAKCYGWDKAALLLVINHSLISDDEQQEEKSIINSYTNQQCRVRVLYWQHQISIRSASNQIA